QPEASQLHGASKGTCSTVTPAITEAARVPVIVLAMRASFRRADLRGRRASDVEEDRLSFALQDDVEGIHRPALTYSALRDEGRPPRLLLDQVEHGVGGIERRLVGEIHARGQADVDAARHDPEADVRRLRLGAPAARHRPRLHRLEAVEPGPEVGAG